MTGTVGTDIGTLTVTQSGGATFGGAVGAGGDRIGDGGVDEHDRDGSVSVTIYLRRV